MGAYHHWFIKSLPTHRGITLYTLSPVDPIIMYINCTAIETAGSISCKYTLKF